MNKIIPLITTANGNLEKQKPMLLDVAKEAAEFIFPRFKVDWDINIVFTNRKPDNIIPENGTGGCTWCHDYIEVVFDEKKTTPALIFETICHELGHAVRWSKNSQWAGTLFEDMVCEGIATHFEAEAHKVHHAKDFYLKTVLERSDAENERILKILRNQLDDEDYDRSTLFFKGNKDKDIPRWAGYSAGYYIVRKYLEQTGKKLEDVFALNYEEFRSVLKDIESVK